MVTPQGPRRGRPRKRAPKTGRRDKGQGGITLRADGRYQATYTDEHGRRRYIYHQEELKVKEKLREALRNAAEGRTVEPGRVTVAQFAERWVRDVKEHTTEAGTARFYRQKIKLIPASVGSMSLKDLTAFRVQEMLAGLLHQGLSPTTVRGVYVTFHAMLGQATRWKLAPRNIMDDVDPPKLKRFQPRVLSATEVSRLLSATADDSWNPLVTVAVTTGMRLGELRALAWDNVDLWRRALSVVATIDEPGGGGWVIKGPKSERGRRTLSLGAVAAAALERQQQLQDMWRSAARARWREHGFVFTTSVGTPLNESAALKHLNRLQAAAGVPRTRFHDLRHTHATLLLLSNVPVHVVAQRLGDDPATVLRTYAHLLPASQRAAAELFDRLLAQSVSDSVSAERPVLDDGLEVAKHNTEQFI